ncbi:MAG: aspartate aminotransferase family protein [Bacteroidota bacterium]
MKQSNQPALSAEGIPAEDLLEQLRRLHTADVAWQDGKVWSLVYHANEEHDQLLKAAYSEYFSTNYLNPLAFRSLQKMEQEVVGMAANLFHGDGEVVGTMSSGGTESLLLAVYTYREWAKKHRPRIHSPEIVAPATIHPAFDKAAHLFGLRIRKAPVDEGQRAIPAEMERLINENTILIAASAPSYPNGILDPIEEIGQIASRRNLPFHVDACIGGFMLPWVERLGNALPAWDFRVPGVSSISADVHKFGYGAKGASVILYKNMSYLRHQFFITTDFPGGIYASPTLLGTRPGGAIAAAWAGMKHLGEAGYLALAKQLMEGAVRLRQALENLPEIRIIGEPCMNIFSFTTRQNKPDIFVVADQLENKGWMVDRQQFPDSIHLTLLPTNVEVIGQYVDDLKVALAFAKAHPEATAQGNAALYGLMARIPFRGMVEKNVRKIFEEMHGGRTGENNEAEVEKSGALAETAAWMGWASRILAGWKRWF